MRSEILAVEGNDEGFLIKLAGAEIQAKSLVVASGGLSMPGLGATPFGYKIAEQFGLPVLPTRAGLVPFTLHKPLLEVLQTLSGIAAPVTIATEGGMSFKESLLFTHRGLSGPAVLQLSSYWQPANQCLLICFPN
ncbi:flavoprotein, HI0933 family [Budvicia aquatica]|uniref:Flavoprotein, HI0933 family n=1 Tax=Budvicia aquatica TaxID=82979 RepID=A0A484ZCM3_9GAMM|nr:flavoprotein, HI0933 family [Budvicia aquatica]